MVDQTMPVDERCVSRAPACLRLRADPSRNASGAPVRVALAAKLHPERTYYYRPGNVDELIEQCTKRVRRLRAPSLPITGRCEHPRCLVEEYNWLVDAPPLARVRTR